MDIIFALVLIVALAALGASALVPSPVRAKPAKTSLLVVGDHRLMCQGVKMLVSQEADLTVCGEADSPDEALRQIEKLSPDLVIIDLSLGAGGGLELLKQINERFPAARTLVLSIRDEPFYAEWLLRAGARGYITREDGTDKLIEAIRKVLAGQIYINDRMAAGMIRTFVAGGAEPGEPLVRRLTDRELEIFELIGQGLSTRTIARKLRLSTKTVGSHREHIKDKLRLDSATDLLRHAIQWTRLPLESPADPPATPGT